MAWRCGHAMTEESLCSGEMGMTRKAQRIEGGCREGFFTSESASGLVQCTLCQHRHKVHAVGASSRPRTRATLTDLCLFGDPTYAKEELVAEMGAAYLCGVCGIANATLANGAAYLVGKRKARCLVGTFPHAPRLEPCLRLSPHTAQHLQIRLGLSSVTCGAEDLHVVHAICIL